MIWQPDMYVSPYNVQISITKHTTITKYEEFNLTRYAYENGYSKCNCAPRMDKIAICLDVDMPVKRDSP